jgi:D-alanyl-lipoteichoic acid acyltransferase DltB (MBOAT superfamily)
MNKKIIIISILVILLCIVSLILINNNKSKKIYLSDEFYGNGIFSEINSDKIDDYSNKTYLLFTYNNYCNFSIPCDKIFQKFSSNNNIEILSISYAEFKKTKFIKEVKYAPSIILIKNNKIITYLDAEKDSDLDKYQDVDTFTNWISDYIYIKK